MTTFLFDMDGTVTRLETLPLIAEHFGVCDVMGDLTEKTVQGKVPFIESFIRRVYVLGDIPVNEVADLLKDVPLYEGLMKFIIKNKEQCAIVTGNLSCWTYKLSERIGCRIYCSEAEVKDGKIEKLTHILKKEDVVRKYQQEGNRVVFVGDGNNDVEAMRIADVAIASGLTHSPASGCISAADYLVVSEVALCRLLNQLL